MLALQCTLVVSNMAAQSFKTLNVSEIAIIMPRGVAARGIR